MEWDTEIPEFTDIRMHGMLCHIDTIIFGCFCEIVSSIEKWELAVWHAHLLAYLIDTIRESDSMDIIYILRGKVHHTTCNISRIFPACEHAPYPVDGSITIRVTQGLMHRRDEGIVFLSILIVHKGLTSSFKY